MSDRTFPTIPKWPFLLSDAALLGVAAWILFRSEAPVSLWAAAASLAAVALGAWVCSIPFLREHQAQLKLAEAGLVSSAVLQFQNIEQVGAQIQNATAQWQGIQESSTRTLEGAREISQRTEAQTRELQAFFQKANDQEKNTLRLEIDKLKRAEADWLHVLVRLIDNVFALHAAGVRSGQERLIAELTQFQNACRDAARRVGLTAFAPETNDPFDPQIHQLPDPKAEPAPGALVSETLAPGLTFQAQLIRRAVVRLAEAPATQPDTSAAAPIAAQEPVSKLAMEPEPAPQESVTEETSTPASAPAPGASDSSTPAPAENARVLVEGTLF